MPTIASIIKKIPRTVLSASWLILLLIAGCSRNIETSGTTSGVDNPEIKMSFEDASGIVQVTGAISVYPVTHNPLVSQNPVYYRQFDDSIQISLTARDLGLKAGKSLLKSARGVEGGFNILILSNQGDKHLIQNVMYDKNTTSFLINGEKTDSISITLTPGFSLSGQVVSLNADYQPIAVHVPGTPYYASVENGNFEITSLPTGIHTIKAVTQTFHEFDVSQLVSEAEPKVNLILTKAVQKLDTIIVNLTGSNNVDSILNNPGGDQDSIINLPPPTFTILFTENGFPIPYNGALSIFLKDQKPFVDPMPLVSWNINNASVKNITPEILGYKNSDVFNIQVLSYDGNGKGALRGGIFYNGINRKFYLDSSITDTLILAINSQHSFKGKVDQNNQMDPVEFVYLPGTPYISQVEWGEYYFDELTENTNRFMAVTRLGNIYEFVISTNPPNQGVVNVGTKPYSGTTQLPVRGLNQLTELEALQGFKLMFNGSDLSQWQTYVQNSATPGAPTDQYTRIENQEMVIHHNGGGVEIRSDSMYGDFEFRAEFKIDSNNVSGFIYRATDEGNIAYKTGPEYAIIDDFARPNLKGTGREMGALHDVMAPTGSVYNIGGYNTMRVICLGNHVEHWLNGVKIVEYEINSPEWLANLAGKAGTSYAQAAKGFLVFQTIEDGNTITWKNIRVASYPLAE